MDDFASAHLLGLLTTRGWLVTYRRAPAVEAEAEAPAAGATVTLEEGEVLFVPKHWWHDVLTLSPLALSVNHWVSILV